MKVVGAHVIIHRMLPTRGEQVRAVLPHKRTQGAPTCPGYWGLFGGGLDSKGHGSPLAAVKRELSEELEGGDEAAENLVELCSVPSAREGGASSIQYYHAALNADIDQPRLKRTDNKVEGEGIAWFTGEEVQHLWLNPEDRIAHLLFFRGAI